MATTIEPTVESTTAMPLRELAEELLSNSRLAQLPFEYDYDTWVLAPDSMRFLLALVQRAAPRKVIEFGSGVSTRVLARILPTGSVIRSFDHVAAYADRTRAAIGAAKGDVQVLHRPISLRFFHGKVLPFYRLQARDCDSAQGADLVVVDGPPGPWGREPALYSAFPFMRPGAVLLLDDAGRPGERAAAAAWQQYFGAAIETHFLPAIGKGLLLVRKRYDRAQGRRFAPAECFGALRHSLRALWRHRPRRPRGTNGHG